MITIDELADSGECPCETCSSQDETRHAPITSEELEGLKQIHFKHYKVRLSDQEAFELGYRLLGLVRATIKPIPEEEK